MTDHCYDVGSAITGNVIVSCISIVIRWRDPPNRSGALSAIEPEEQVTHRPTAKQCQPALTAVFGTIMGKMASLAQCREICGIVVAWVMIEVGTRRHDTRRSWRWGGGGQIREPKLAGLQSVWRRQAGRASAAIIPPLSASLIIPPTVTEVENIVAMGTPTPLATALRTLEADYLGQLLPIDRVKPAVFGADRHQTSMNHSALERKENSGENRCVSSCAAAHEMRFEANK